MGVSAGLGAALSAGAASAGSRGLQSSVLLPPQPHRDRIRVLSLSVDILQLQPHLYHLRDCLQDPTPTDGQTQEEKTKTNMIFHLFLLLHTMEHDHFY